ncbi:multi antimicrobial extrusion protein (Na(+)/drug antiporter), MATE family of MDR efflux pumps [Lachnospiraceae bacterium KM106-2]|nr:multi antimicrobial extrusion protein (Na(+)/drug antiporter), MATE family of MDR efflux pumps [Lachnospiraceae bacterium KM106-2]
MERSAVESKFAKYVISSMITMFLQSFYSIVDGLFISNMVGGVGLSAINVVWPIIAVIVAVGAGVGSGGSVLMSIKQGEGKQDESNVIRGNIISLLAVVGVILMIVFSIGLSPSLQLMGAKGKIYNYGMQYGLIMVLGSCIEVYAAGLTPLLRNDSRAVSSMVIMISGLACNILLDFVFIAICHGGIIGAALASLLSQCLTSLSCIVVLICNKDNPLRKAHFVLSAKKMKKIFITGISPFGISLTPSLLILYNNVACIHYGGDAGIAIYSLVSSTIGSYRLLLIGVADGIQPLVSFTKGANDYKAMKRIRNRGIRVAIGLSILLFLFTLLTEKCYGALFGFSKDITKMSLLPITLEATQLIFTGMVRVSNSFFYAVGKTRYSLFMIYFDPVVMTPVILMLLPRMMGMNGVWISTTISQVILNIVAVVMYVRHNREITIQYERGEAVYERDRDYIEA